MSPHVAEKRPAGTMREDSAAPRRDSSVRTSQAAWVSAPAASVEHV
jgi:hypothetical protein